MKHTNNPSAQGTKIKKKESTVVSATKGTGVKK